jgi:hypothetical protein
MCIYDIIYTSAVFPKSVPGGGAKWDVSETLCSWQRVCNAAAHRTGGPLPLLRWLCSLGQLVSGRRLRR